MKNQFQTALIKAAKTQVAGGLRLVFYDVTTLYFESTAKVGLRAFGFSKDHKSQQTQIVLGLVVNPVGFPVYFDIFTGSTFEGHTFLPTVTNIAALLGQPDLVVVADAAMLAKVSLSHLDGLGVRFIIGARLANLSSALIADISQTLAGRENAFLERRHQDFRLLCHYSTSRAAKDKSDRQRQVDKAQTVINRPSAFTSRFKFVKQSADKSLLLDSELISKAASLEGIKGYLTNTTLDPQLVIDRYHDLWQIEHTFRVSKTDLEARPIFHRLDETITAHVTIIFAALAVSKYLELATGLSINRIITAAEKLLTNTLVNTKTGQSTQIETVVQNPAYQKILTQLKTLMDTK